MCNKSLVEKSFNELVDEMTGMILLAIVKGEFRTAVWQAMDIALRWKAEKDEAKKTQG
jgi:hypothetical protein